MWAGATATTRPSMSWQRRAVRMAAVYFVIAATWVIASDVVMDRLLDDSARTGMIKGVLFVLVTSGLLLLVSFRWGRTIDGFLRALWRDRTVYGIIGRVDSTLLNTGDLSIALQGLCDDAVELTDAVHAEICDGDLERPHVLASAGRGVYEDDHPNTFAIYGDDSRVNRWLCLYTTSTEPDPELPRIGDDLASRLGRSITIAAQQQRFLELSAAVETAADAIAIVSPDFTITWANSAFCRITGYDFDEVLGLRADFLVDNVAAAEVGSVAWRTVLDGHAWRGELLMRRRDGSLYTARHTLSPIMDASGRVQHAISVHDDLTHQRQMEKRLARLATHDPLTSLPNRYLFVDRATQQLTAPDHPTVAIATFGLAGFTEVNEALGNKHGDELLRHVGARLQAQCSDGETAACVHGDQFALLLLGHDGPGDLASRAEQMLATIREPISLDGRAIALNARAGIAVHPSDGESADALLSHATTAMHLASRTGRSRLQFHAQAHNHAAHERLQLHSDLRRALVEDQLVLHFQPQVMLTSGAWVAVEALIRWQHPDLGLLPPSRFLHIIDESDLSAEVNRWVLDTALAACHELRARVPTAHVGVNISASHFDDGDVVNLAAAALSAAELPPSALEIELLEGTLFSRGSIPSAVGELRAMGVRLAVDDFGTGYNSLARVADLPMDVVKIDRSFVTDIDQSPTNRSIVHAIKGIADALGVVVLAEGVETEREAQTLTALGCDTAQGFYFARPMPLANLLDLLDRQLHDHLLRPLALDAD